MSKNIQNLIAAQKQRAVELMQQGKLKAAHEIASKLCRKNKSDAESQYILGSIFGKMKRYNDAVNQFKVCIKLQPDAFIAHLSLGQAYTALKNHSAAEKAYREALRLKPDETYAQVLLGVALAEQGNLTDAENLLLKVLKNNPTSSESLDVLGDIYYQQQQFQRAINYYQRALKIEPNRIDSNAYLGNSLFLLGRTDKAIHYFQKVVQLDPKNYSTHVHLGHCFKQSGEPDKARKAYEDALKIEPDNPTASEGILDLLEREGEFENAYELLVRQIKRGEDTADLAAAYVRLCHRFDTCDEAIDYAQRVIKNPNLSAQDISRLEYALGRKFDQMGEFDTAFFHYQCANKLPQQNFDPHSHTAFIDALIQLYSWQFFTQAPRATVRSDRPVFIVGMPRSGTSLTEQILASHPAVYGAGELTDIGDEVTSMSMSNKQAPYPAIMNNITVSTLDEIANRYLEHLSNLSNDTIRVTDKQPTNFLHLGLIALAFPEARIIHCTRNPLDNCLSIYFQAFSDANRYANKLEHIGLYFRQYKKFMTHIKGLLNIPVLEVPYEELVADQVGITRKLIQFIDLDWDEQCLEFNKNKRFVATPSYDQVRESIYTRAVGRWKNYEKHLEPLIAVLK